MIKARIKLDYHRSNPSLSRYPFFQFAIRERVRGLHSFLPANIVKVIVSDFPNDMNGRIVMEVSEGVDPEIDNLRNPYNHMLLVGAR